MKYESICKSSGAIKTIAVIFAIMLGGCAVKRPNLPEVEAVDPLEYRDLLSGWWDRGQRSEMDQFCGEGRNLHRHIFLEGGQTVKWQFQRPLEKSDGETSYTYRIVDASSVSLTMYIADESQRKENGELWLWELVIVADGLYRWRAASFPVGTYNDIWGRRCD